MSRVCYQFQQSAAVAKGPCTQQRASWTETCVFTVLLLLLTVASTGNCYYCVVRTAPYLLDTAALKKETRCQACGEKGHWKGDAESSVKGVRQAARDHRHPASAPGKERRP